MKHYIFIIFTILARTILAQLGIDGNGLIGGNEYLEKLILNQIENNKTEFKVILKDPKHRNYKYQYKHLDTIIYMKSDGDILMFNEQLKWIPNSKDSLEYDFRNWFKTKSNSANQIEEKSFKVENGDTVLQYFSKTEFDTIGRPINQASNFSKYKIQEKTTYQYFDNSTLKKRFKKTFTSNEWKLVSTVNTINYQNKIIIHELNFDFWMKEMVIVFELKGNRIRKMDIMTIDDDQNIEYRYLKVK